MRALWRRLAPFIGVALSLTAFWVLRDQLQRVVAEGLLRAIRQIPWPTIALALALTAINYAVLTGYDLLAFTDLGRRIARWRISLASFIGYAVANSVGFAALSGTAARYRFYSRWGLTPAEISRVVIFYMGTFWLGLFVLGGWSLVFSPPAGLSPHFLPHAWATSIGVVLLIVCAAYAIAPLLGRGHLTLFGVDLSLPAPRLVASQFLLSVVDWALAVAVLWVLIPAPRPPFLMTASAFVTAQALGLLVQAPGAIGVFEVLMTVFLGPTVPAGMLWPALVAFRVIYYLVPLSVALVALFIDEAYVRRHAIQRGVAAIHALSISLAPRLLAGFTFLAGAVLLFSGATPAITSRLAFLANYLPDPVVDLSHFLGSLIGLFLLLMSQALARRVDAAWTLTVGALAIGIATTLLKGADYEEALILGLLLFVLVRARKEFDRRATLFHYTFSRLWFTAVILVVVASAVLGVFAFRDEFTNDFFWHSSFGLWGPQQNRFLRATVGVAVVVLALGIRQLLRPAVPPLKLARQPDFESLARVIATQRSTSAFLVYLRDKAIMWNDARTAFLMYGVQGRTWVALHDPVGPAAEVAGLIRRFIEMVDDADGVPVFYEIGRDNLHRYADFGLAFAKAGEEALVSLPSFSLDGGDRKKLRLQCRKLEHDGATFRVVPESDVPLILPALREVSNAWLADKASTEKGFSLGFWADDYVTRFPVALLEVGGRIEAFATVWPGPGKVELSVDLMRHRPDAPKNSMEGLFVFLMQWGRAEGYQWFNLGMAPLSGMQTTALAPLWVKFASYLYRYGDLFYNFQGLRAYKDKFDPVWESRYLAYPGGLALPRVLADVSALIAGGYRGILLRRGR